MADIKSFSGSYYISFNQLQRAVDELKSKFISWQKDLSQNKSKIADPSFSFSEHYSKLVKFLEALEHPVYDLNEKSVLEFLHTKDEEHIEIRKIHVENLKKNTRLDHLPIITMDADLHITKITPLHLIKSGTKTGKKDLIEERNIDSFLIHDKNLYLLIRNLHNLILFNPKIANKKGFNYVQFLKEYTKYPNIKLNEAKTPEAKLEKNLTKKINKESNLKSRLTVSKESAVSNDIKSIKSWIDSYDPSRLVVSDKDYENPDQFQFTEDERINTILDKFGIKTLFTDLMACIKPSTWLQLLCEKAIKEIGIIHMLEIFTESGILQQLRDSSADLSKTIDNILAKKQISSKSFTDLLIEKADIDKRQEYVKDEIKGNVILQDVIEKAETATEIISNSLYELAKHDELATIEVTAIMAQVGEFADLTNRSFAIDTEIEKLKNIEFEASLTINSDFLQDAGGSFQELSEQFQSAIGALEDPNLRQNICDTILNATPSFEGLTDVDVNTDIDVDFEFEFKLPKVERPTMPKIPKLPTDDIYAFITKAVKQAVQAAIEAIILVLVEQLLSSLLEACTDLKDDLISSLRDDEVDSPNDSLAEDFLDDEFPNESSMDLAASAVALDAELLNEFVADMAAILSPVELCMLLKNELPRAGRLMTEKVLKARHPSISEKLSEPKEIFAVMDTVGRLLGPICDDIFSTTFNSYSTAVDLCKDPNPASRDLRCKLLENVLTDEECEQEFEELKATLKKEEDDIMRRMIDTLVNSDSLFDELREQLADPYCDKGSTQPVFPKNGPHKDLLDLTLRTALEPVEVAFVSDIKSFKNKAALLDASQVMPNPENKEAPIEINKGEFDFAALKIKPTYADVLMAQIHTVKLDQPTLVTNENDFVSTYEITRGEAENVTKTVNKVIPLANGNSLFFVQNDINEESIDLVMACEISPTDGIVFTRYGIVAQELLEKAELDIQAGIVSPNNDYLDKYRNTLWGSFGDLHTLPSNIIRELHTALQRNIHGVLLQHNIGVISGPAFLQMVELLIPKTVWDKECNLDPKAGRIDHTPLLVQKAVTDSLAEICPNPAFATPENNDFENSVEQKYVDIMIRLYIVDFVFRTLPIIKFAYSRDMFDNDYVAAAITGYMRTDLINRSKKKVFTGKGELSKKTYFTEVVRILRTDEDESEDSIEILTRRVRKELATINDKFIDIAELVFEDDPVAIDFNHSVLEQFDNIPIITDNTEGYFYDYKNATVPGFFGETTGETRIKTSKAINLYKTSVGNTGLEIDEYDWFHKGLKDSLNVQEPYKYYEKFSNLFLGASFAYQYFTQTIDNDGNIMVYPYGINTDTFDPALTISYGSRLVMVVLDDHASNSTKIFMDAAKTATSPELKLYTVNDLNAAQKAKLTTSEFSAVDVNNDGPVFLQPLFEYTQPNKPAEKEELLTQLIDTPGFSEYFLDYKHIDLELFWFMHLLNVHEYVGDAMPLYDKVFNNTKGLLMESFFSVIHSSEIRSDLDAGESLLTKLQAAENDVTNFVHGLKPDLQSMYEETPFLLMKGVADLIDPFWEVFPATIFGLVAKALDNDFNNKTPEEQQALDDKKKDLNCPEETN